MSASQEVDQLQKALDKAEEDYGGLYLEFKKIEREWGERGVKIMQLQAELDKVANVNEHALKNVLKQISRGSDPLLIALKEKIMMLQKWAAKRPCEIVEDGERSCTVHYDESRWCIPCQAKDTLKGDIK